MREPGSIVHTVLEVLRRAVGRPNMRRRPDYSDKPTIVVALAEHGQVIGAHAEGFGLPEKVRLIVRDFAAGTLEDEEGLIYEDREVLPGDASPAGRVTVALPRSQR